ncbi:MAG: NAD(P)H-dependent oxidoreductase subunit E [Fibrobacteria bacterium]|nr:NAD(P)H-dependent oxidoreductase subunit E [Fibrobacteria bacterium]
MKRTRGKKGRETGCTVNTQALAEVRELLGDAPRSRDLLIEHLHKIQDAHNHLSDTILAALAFEMCLPIAEVFETATFYHHFDIVKKGEKAPPELTVRVCTSLTCSMFGANELIEKLKIRYNGDIRIQAVPCVGRCQGAPVAVAGTYPIELADEKKVEDAIRKGQTWTDAPHFLNYHKYRKAGGYQTYLDCINGKYSRDEIIKMLDDSSLCGLGGAGFPVGTKWKILREQAGPRLIAINIDEGEPGTFKDRYHLERDPHRFIEGALIAHWAIEAESIYIYLRDEYAGCRTYLEREFVLLKADPPAPLPPIYLRRGAGAYICGEESAMIESIEGKRGLPRMRPPYIAQVGLFGKPTLEQNMESMHWVTDVIQKGPAWFGSHGRNGHRGLRSFSVSGRVNKPGVHLAPAGITLRELIDEYCDGMLPGHQLHGYFPGGASGGILPASMADIPLNWDTLKSHGCFLGSAAVVVFSNQDSVKELALNAMRFFRDESCGQCTPCRVGTAKAAHLMEQEHWDKPLLEELSKAMTDSSICGLGQAAPNPFRCAIKYFPEEFS